MLTVIFGVDWNSLPVSISKKFEYSFKNKPHYNPSANGFAKF